MAWTLLRPNAGHILALPGGEEASGTARNSEILIKGISGANPTDFTQATIHDLANITELLEFDAGKRDMCVTYTQLFFVLESMRG